MATNIVAAAVDVVDVVAAVAALCSGEAGFLPLSTDRVWLSGNFLEFGPTWRKLGELSSVLAPTIVK